VLSPNGVSVFKTFSPQSDAIRSDHSLTRNVPKLIYSNVRFQNFPRRETPGPPLKGGTGSGGKGREGDGKGKNGMGKGQENGNELETLKPPMDTSLIRYVA